tara:strand:- start:492 stop:647 length:156 start_codon:yes stop_codon:yes gene_type:complete
MPIRQSYTKPMLLSPSRHPIPSMAPNNRSEPGTDPIAFAPIPPHIPIHDRA